MTKCEHVYLMVDDHGKLSRVCSKCGTVDIVINDDSEPMVFSDPNTIIKFSVTEPKDMLSYINRDEKIFYIYPDRIKEAGLTIREVKNGQ